jgi:hypothetical protein
LFQGVVRVNPAQVQRGRNSLIRGTVKLAPGNNLEQKKQLKKQLTEASTPIMAVLGVTLVGLAGHAGLKKGFAAYRNGVGAQIDRAATTAVDSILDRMPGVAGNRAATRAAGASAANEIAGVVTRGQRLVQTRVATSGNVGRIGPLSFRPNAANTEASGLRSSLDQLNARARAGQLSYDEYRSSAVQTLYGARSPGTRPNGQRGSIFSEHAANEFLTSKFGLNGAGAVGSSGGYSMAARNALVDTQVAERLGAWGQAMRNDMQIRRMTGPQGNIRTRDINEYIRTVGANALGQPLAGMNAAQRRQATSEANRLMRSVLSGNNLNLEARSMRRSLVSEFDTYFENTAQMMRRNAAASDSPFGDGLTGLARYVRRTTNNPGPILSRDHADLIVRNDYHTRVMQLRNDYTIGENTARRIAQQITRSPNLPDVDSAFRVLNQNGFPRLSRRGPTTGRAPAQLRNLTQLTRDILARPGNQGMSRAAAEREARRIIEQRGRTDAAGAERLGKPCGESNIPKSHKCSKNVAPANGQVLKTAATVALATGAVAGAAVLLSSTGKKADLNSRFDIHHGLDPNDPEYGRKHYEKIRDTARNYSPKEMADQIRKAGANKLTEPEAVELCASWVEKHKIGLDPKALEKVKNDVHPDDWEELVTRPINSGGYFDGHGKEIWIRRRGHLDRWDGRAVDSAIDGIHFNLDKIKEFQGLSSQERFGKEGVYMPAMSVFGAGMRNRSGQDLVSFLHEVGHSVHYAANRFSTKPFTSMAFGKPRLINPKASDFQKQIKKVLSNYGTQDLSGEMAEAFAESSVLYVLANKRLLQDAPLVHAWVEYTYHQAHTKADKKPLMRNLF